MRNERMYAELVELLKTDSASGRESAVAELLKKKLAELGLDVFQDNAGETFGGECGNVIGVWEGSLDGALMLSAHMDRVPNGQIPQRPGRSAGGAGRGAVLQRRDDPGG